MLPDQTIVSAGLHLTEEEYDALPREVADLIEVVDGRVVHREPPSSERRRVVRNLVAALSPVRPTPGSAEVRRDADMKFSTRRGRSRFTIRRPDVSVFRPLPEGAEPTSADVCTAIEVTDPASRTGFAQKLAEYAGQRIPVFLVVAVDKGRVQSVDEYRLDGSGRSYEVAAVHSERLAVELSEGLNLNATFADLARV
ncbi:Uma2 family endonuclease [Actinocorallia longicatena]|uniref:Putative restriction endonuclease domain-containing protein n=1 Tax=Actinocorallia longicatena TaxID=111803 RepID=A0ABP6Q5E7_9ACTN